MNEQEYPKVHISEEEALENERIFNAVVKNLKEFSKEKDPEYVSVALGKIIDIIIERLSSEGELLLLCTGKTFEEDYIFAHSLDVCLISLRIGIKLGYDRKKLKDVGYLALTHSIKDTGFPEELTKKIKPDREMSEVVRLADVYDAMTHPPFYRHGMIPYDALEEIISSDKFFDRRLIKILLDEVSFYPKGSWVQLSSKEIGKVIKINKGQLLRPTVEVVIDWEGSPLKEPKIVDLAQKQLIHVLRPLSREEINQIKESM